MNGKFEVLKVFLSEIVFARVVHTVAKDENLISFIDRRSITRWSDEPDFQKERLKINQRDWYQTYRSYTFYFGFAHNTNNKPIHFSSKGHRYNNEDYADLGIITKQHACCPPKNGSWIVGSVVTGDKGPRFHNWSRCTEQEMLFTKFLLEGKSRFSSDNQRRLYVNRHIDDGEHTNHLINMAMLLLAQDLNYYLDHRQKHGGSGIDEQVFEICEEYAPELWEEYKEKALAQKLDPVLKYSELIPEPAPKPIVEIRATEAGKPPVGISTPFKSLKIET